MGFVLKFIKGNLHKRCQKDDPFIDEKFVYNHSYKDLFKCGCSNYPIDTSCIIPYSLLNDT